MTRPQNREDIAARGVTGGHDTWIEGRMMASASLALLRRPSIWANRMGTRLIVHENSGTSSRCGDVGAAGGANVKHTHSQLIVTAIVPISLWDELTGALEFYTRS
jgi:hypothetical protein